MVVDVAILGAGVAGCVLARQLAADGRQVVVIGTPRPPSWEGLSPRAQQGFIRAGCHDAARLGHQPTPRHALWNGQPSASNQEYLFHRPHLDAALRADAAQAGSRVIAARVKSLHLQAAGWQIHVADHSPIQARLVVEARGRSAITRQTQHWAGIPTLAIGQQYRIPHQETPISGVTAFADGWAWFATFGPQRLVVQIFVDARRRIGTRQDWLAAFAQLPGTDGPLPGLLDQAIPVGRIFARDATPRLSRHPLQDGLLRVGDAAYAADPLSGQGMYEAVGGAMAAHAHITTQFDAPSQASASARYYQERIAERFDRLVRAGQQFYQAETRWRDRNFWRQRAEMDLSTLPSPLAPPPHPHVDMRPVAVNRGIENRPVIVTPQHPRGVWSIADVPVAELLRTINHAPHTSLPDLSHRLQRSPHQVEQALAWLRQQGVIHSTAPQ